MPELPTLEPEAEPGEVDTGRGGACTLLGHLAARVERSTEELAEPWTEMRGVRCEARSLRDEMGRAKISSALMEAERARKA